MALVTFADVERAHGGAICSTTAPAVAGWIAALEAEVTSAVGPLGYVEDDELTIRPSRAVCEVFLWGPVHVEPTITIEGDAVTLCSWSKDGRVDLGRCACAGDEIAITWTHGYQTIPADLTGMLANKLSAAVRARTIADTAMAGPAGSFVTSASSGGTSVGYADPTGIVIDAMTNPVGRFLMLSDDERRWLRRRFRAAAGSTLLR